MGWQSVLQMLFALGCIIFLANFILKKLNSMQQKQHHAITIIERVPVSKSSALCIVDIANIYYLMSISDKGSEIVKELSKEEQIEIDRRVKEKQEKLKESIDLKRKSESLKQLLEKLREKYHDIV